MCGIAGVYNYGNMSAVDPGIVKGITGALIHRGPDDEGFHFKGPVGLGHRRLAIIDLDGGHQPMSNEDGSVWIVFNGEIYNFQELNEDLVRKGHCIRTRCDTETIVHLYEEYGVGCLEKLRGMFAFAIWDEGAQSLFLARDRIGKKPLHYTLAGGAFIFASEIKALLEHPSVKRELDYESLHDYLSLMYVPAPGTMFKGIKKLSAGHYLTCRNGAIKTERYWDIDFSGGFRGKEKDAAEAVYEKLGESTRIRLHSDVPLGAFLSGGIDSSSVVSMASRLKAGAVITNSIGFSSRSYDELHYARILAKRYSTDHHEYVVSPDVLDTIDKLTYFFDEPFGDASSVPTYHVSRMARQNVVVALSGDGGDENFAGYKRYLYSDIVIRCRRFIPGFLRHGVKEALYKISAGSRGGWDVKLRNKAEELCMDPFELYFKIISMYKEDEKALLYSAGVKNRMREYSTKEKFRGIFNACKSDEYVSKMQYLDIKTYLTDDILVKVDRASMANSLEVRSPMLDHEFMEYAATLPASFKLEGFTGKSILRKAVSRDIPGEIMRRAKMGFGVPMTDWLRGAIKDSVEKELFDKDGIVLELFDPGYVRKMWDLTQRSRIKGFRKTDFSYRVWLLYVLSRWHKRYKVQA